MKAGVAVGLVLVLVCIIALVGFAITSNKGSDSSDNIGDSRNLSANEATIEDSSSSSSSLQVAREHRDFQVSDVLAIPGSDTVVMIDVASDPVTQSECTFDVSDVYKVLAEIEEGGDCGFVFLDADTGRGLAYHADTATYIASASKAVLAHYALMNGAGSGGEYEESIESAITDSDNDSYEAFGYAYANEGYGEWLADHDAWFDAYQYDLYPPMSARSLASFWVEILNYIKSGSENAQWFAGLLESTDVSFIRSGIDDSNAVVMNKAGWIADDEYFSSVSDSAIIQADGRTFVMTIVTGQSDWELTEEYVAELASCLYSLRDKL